MPIELFIYLANVLDNVGWVLFWTALALIVANFLVLMVNVENEKQPWQRLNTLFAVGSFVAFMGFALMPSERTMYLMAGASLAKQAIHTETADKVQRLVNAKLDDMIDGLTKPKK